MRRMLATLIGAAATITMITGTGVAAASSAHPVGAGHPAGSHRAVTGTEHFQAVSASLSGRRSPVVAYGVFNASGVDVTTGNTTDRFKFPGGSFRVKHKVTHSRQHFSKRTCSGTFRQRGTYKLSRGRGTYAGIRGHGHFTVSGLLVARHTTHGCSKNPIAIQVVIRAHGPVTLP